MPRFIWIASAAYAVVLSLLGIDRYAIYRSGADLGEFVQTTASVLHGFADTAEGGSHFLHHFSPILAVVAPLVIATHSAIALIVVQAVAGALVAPAIYLIARRRTGERLSRLVAIVALLYPALVGVTFTDFHENGFAPATIAWLAWAVLARRWAWVAALALVALAIKEDEAFILAVLGAAVAVLAIRRGDRSLLRAALAIAVASVATLALYFLVVRPIAGANGEWFALGYFAADIPHQSGFAAVYGRISYVLEVFVPLAFLPFASPWLALALPGIAEVLASRWSITYTMGQHYAGAWTGEMLVAFALGAVAIEARQGTLRAQRWVVAALVLCVLNLSLASPTHWRHYLGVPSTHDAVLDRFVAAVPDDLTIGTHDEIYAHLGFNPGARINFGNGPLPQLALFDDRYDSPEWTERVRPRLHALVVAGRYAVQRSEDGVTLYRRVDP